MNLRRSARTRAEASSSLRTQGPSARAMAKSLAIHGAVLCLLLMLPARALGRSVMPEAVDVVFHRPPVEIPVPKVPIPSSLAAPRGPGAPEAPGPRTARLKPPAALATPDPGPPPGDPLMADQTPPSGPVEVAAAEPRSTASAEEAVFPEDPVVRAVAVVAVEVAAAAFPVATGPRRAADRELPAPTRRYRSSSIATRRRSTGSTTGSCARTPPCR